MSDRSTASKIAGILRAISGAPDPKNFTSAVIVAAGRSSRMNPDGSDVCSKPLMPLDGIPMVIHTLRAFESACCIHEIVVVTRESEISFYEQAKHLYNLTKLTQVVLGGDTRQDSARLGSDVIDSRARYIAIADAARCLITPEDINKVCHAAYRWEAATAATPSTDTVKIADTSLFIESTPERGRTWLAQTPQVFRVPLYRTAAYACRDEGFTATDDNQLCEHIHVPVKLVPCSKENIKLTDPSDVPFIETILRRRREQQNLKKMQDETNASSAQQGEKKKRGRKGKQKQQKETSGDS